MRTSKHHLKPAPAFKAHVPAPAETSPLVAPKNLWHRTPAVASHKLSQRTIVAPSNLASGPIPHLPSAFARNSPRGATASAAADIAGTVAVCVPMEEVRGVEVQRKGEILGLESKAVVVVNAGTAGQSMSIPSSAAPFPAPLRSTDQDSLSAAPKTLARLQEARMCSHLKRVVMTKLLDIPVQVSEGRAVCPRAEEAEGA